MSLRSDGNENSNSLSQLAGVPSTAGEQDVLLSAEEQERRRIEEEQRLLVSQEASEMDANFSIVDVDLRLTD